MLLERKQLTSGTTWHAAGEVVSGGASEDPLWMARYSRDLYTRLEEETGLSTGFKQVGYLQLATTERRDEAYRRETAYCRSMGMTKEILSPKEILDIVPMMQVDDIIHGFWTPDEGRANPVDVTMSMAKGAGRRAPRSSKRPRSPTSSSRTDASSASSPNGARSSARRSCSRPDSGVVSSPRRLASPSLCRRLSTTTCSPSRSTASLHRTFR